MAFEIKDISVSFDEKQVLNSVNLLIPEEKKIAFLAPSGRGKSTLLKVITRLIEPDSGELLNFPDIFSYLSQETHLFPWMTVMRNLEIIRPPHIEKQKWRNAGKILLDKFGLKGEYSSYPDTLSGGMKRRLELVRALLFPAPLILLDEPFASLDLNLRHKVAALLGEVVREEKRSLIFTTHHVDTALTLADYILVFNEYPAGTLTLSENSIAALSPKLRDEAMKQKIGEIAFQMIRFNERDVGNNLGGEEC